MEIVGIAFIYVIAALVIVLSVALLIDISGDVVRDLTGWRRRHRARSVEPSTVTWTPQPALKERVGRRSGKRSSAGITRGRRSADG